MPWKSPETLTMLVQGSLEEIQDKCKLGMVRSNQIVDFTF